MMHTMVQSEQSLIVRDSQATIKAWLAEVVNRTGSIRTAEEYSRILARFLGTLEGSEPTTAHVHAFAYGRGPSGKEPSPSTIILRLAAIRSYYDFLRRMGGTIINPANDVKRPRKRQATPKGLDSSQLRQLLSVIPATPAGARDRAIIITMVLTGLRRHEVMSLKAGDLSRNDCIFYKVRVKGGQERRRELPLPAFVAIENSLEVRGTNLEKLDSSEPLFNVSAQGFYLNLQRYTARAGLKGVTPHVLRHSAAKLRRDTGSTLEEISELLGHKDIATTALYLARLQGERDNGWQGAAAKLGLI